MRGIIKILALIACVIISVICKRYLTEKYGVSNFDAFIAFAPAITAYAIYAYWLATTVKK